MKVVEFYAMIDGDYAGVSGRIKNEQNLIIFLKRFIDDGDFLKMVNAFEDNNYLDAFKASHSLKGLCANLGITSLQQIVSELCETVRYGAPDRDISSMLEEAKEKYELVIKSINEIE